MNVNIDRNEIYEKLLEENGSVIYLADLETYELVYVTRGTLRMLGRSLTDTSYVGRKCHEVLQGRALRLLQQPAAELQRVRQLGAF